MIFVDDYSLLTWSNESINIWSHLIGFLVFLFLLIYDNVVSLSVLDCSFTDQLVVSIGLCCYQVSYLTLCLSLPLVSNKTWKAQFNGWS